MKAILFVGHGELPVSMKHSAQMIVGETNHLFALSLMEDDGRESFLSKLELLNSELQEYDSMIVFVDLMGGSPCNCILEKYMNDSRVTIIAGMNLPMVLSAIMGNGNVTEILKDGREQIVDVKNRTQRSEHKKTEQKGAPFTIKNVRVDARGIHGQVATAWVPSLKLDRIIVIDDIAIKDETQRVALKMAKPNAVKLSLLSTKKAVERLNDKDAYLDESILVILQRVETIQRMKDLGYVFKEVTLGNVPKREATKAYYKTINLTDDEVMTIKSLIEGGTHFTTQMVPSDAKVNFDEIIKK